MILMVAAINASFDDDGPDYDDGDSYIISSVIIINEKEDYNNDDWNSDRHFFDNHDDEDCV